MMQTTALPSAPRAAAGSAEGRSPRPAAPRRRRVRATRRLRNISLWSRQLHVLVRCGTPLAQALGAVERQSHSTTFRAALTDVRRQIDEGASLSEAMARHGQHFDAVSRSLVAAGESSGQLDRMLDRLAALTRQQLRMRRSLIGSMVYPCLLVVVAAGVLTTLIVFVLPRFAELFTTLDAPLPPTTRFLMALSAAARTHWWMLLGAAVCLAVAGRLLLVSQAGKRLLDRAAVSLPYFGIIVRDITTARIIRLLGSLLSSQVQLLDALILARESGGNHLYVRLMGAAADAVTRGEPLSAVLSRTRLVNPSVAEAVHHGEQTGQLGPMLTDMADFMDEENETTMRTLTSVIEPLILIVLGVVVAIVAVSMFMPLFDVTAMTQQGG